MIIRIPVPIIKTVRKIDDARAFQVIVDWWHSASRCPKYIPKGKEFKYIINKTNTVIEHI